MNRIIKTFGISTLALLPWLASSALAQEAVDALPEIEVDRSAEELNDRIREIPEDRDLFDTALLFTSYDSDDRTVHCVAFNARGERIGRARAKLPSHGVRLVFASDIARQLDFLGKINCVSRGQVEGSAYLVGPEFSDLRSITRRDRAGSRILVPVALNR